MIIDFIGAGYFSKNLAAAALDGRIVLLGLMGGTSLPTGVDIGAILRKRLRIEGSTLRSRDLDYVKNLRDTVVQDALPRFLNGEFKVYVERVFPFENIIEAHKLLESNQTKGKIVCTI